MTRVVLSARVRHDLERIEQHLLLHDAADVEGRVAEILSGLAILESHPLIGRKVAGNRRELVIGRGSHGYVALYAYDAGADALVVAAVRAQRESGYSGG
ncbi:MAG: type II toxin-antitoxin system RelE/ParE family toxin [Rubrivivax sp.]|nr:type II toxin-antitoxin system RelE/ParE family toxin [Rubrivivax sp.]